MISMKKITAVVLIVFMIGSMTSACSSGSANNVISQDEAPAETPIKDHATVSYLGPQGTYTEEAARFFFRKAVSWARTITLLKWRTRRESKSDNWRKLMPFLKFVISAVLM